MCLQLLTHVGQPIFTSPTYASPVDENTPVGTVLDLDIQALGPDNTPVTYSITTDGITAFSINQTTGEITVEENIDYEKQQLYEFGVGATDQTDRIATVNITITVLDVNDNQPVFSRSEYNTFISEDSAVGSTITALTATDADSGTNAKISYSITGGNEEGRFRLESTRGILSTASTLDRETTASYTLTVQAIDGGSPPLSSRANIMINITDVNDNSPIFNQSIYSAILSFDTLKEWFVTVRATDQDSGANASITYSIIGGNEGGILTINAESGEIRVAETFNPEKFPIFNLTVQATDGGIPTRNGQARVSITIDTDTSTIASTAATTSVLSTPCGSTATLHSVKLLLYPLLPLLVLLISAAIRM